VAVSQHTHVHEQVYTKRTDPNEYVSGYGRLGPPLTGFRRI